MKIPFEWESLNFSCSRAKVMGGWIVKSYNSGNNGMSESMIFIPDSEHEWEILYE